MSFHVGDLSGDEPPRVSLCHCVQTLVTYACLYSVKMISMMVMRTFFARCDILGGVRHRIGVHFRLACYAIGTFWIVKNVFLLEEM